MSDPRVTVIVAAFNGERFLRETLESVFAQDFDSYEVVFVDDGSEDRTGEIAQSFPVRYVRQENQGLPAARNAGLALARGDLVAFLDDDDVLPPTKLRVQARYLDEHPETGCVLGRQEWIVEEGVEPPPLVRDPIFGEVGGIQLVTAMIRASGSRPSARARDAAMRTSAAAPSVIPDEFPAVIVPVSSSKTGFSFARPSSVVSGRGCSSRSTATVAPFFAGTATGTISFARRSHAASAFCCDRKANSSCSSRGISYLRARFSAVSPMIRPQSGSRNPSLFIPS